MRTPAALGVVTLVAAACGGGGEPPAAPADTTTTTVAAARAGLPALDAQKSLEASVGSTAPLVQSVTPAPAPVAGVPGVPGTSPAVGPPDALVHVVMFTDFQCPVCRRVVEPMKLLVRTFPADVRLVVKHAASPRHARAEDAAAASLAAFRQSAFWPFYDRAFVDQRRLEIADLVGTAEALALDVARFRADMDDEAVRAQVRYETALAAHLGVSGTPSFVVNGHVQRGWGSYAGMEHVVRRELARAEALLASGVPRADVAREATRASDPERGPALAAALFDGGA
jgi:protein-disulfide isomerase